MRWVLSVRLSSLLQDSDRGLIVFHQLNFPLITEMHSLGIDVCYTCTRINISVPNFIQLGINASNNAFGHIKGGFASLLSRLS